MTVQKGNVENQDMLSAFFPMRTEPNYALPMTISSFLALPNLRGFWPFSSRNESGNVIDLSGQDRTLTYNTSPVAAMLGLLPIITLNGSSQYYYRADEAGLSITGALTLCGWFKPATVVGNHSCIAKDNTTTDRSYTLIQQADVVNFTVFGGGTNKGIASAAGSFVQDQWHFLAGRFTPSTEVAVWVNGVKSTNVAAIMASLDDTAAQLTIGYNVFGYFSGSAALCAIGAYAWPDAVITNLFQQSRVLFGV